MPRYGVVWAEVPKAQYHACTSQLQRGVDAAVETLAEKPKSGRYQPCTDLWTLPVRGEVALLVYAVVPAHAKVIVLRLVFID